MPTGSHIATRVGTQGIPASFDDSLSRDAKRTDGTWRDYFPEKRILSIYIYRACYSYFLALLAVMLPEIQSEGEYSDDFLGYLMSTQMLFGMVSSYTAGILVQNYGSAAVMFWSTVLQCLQFPFIMYYAADSLLIWVPMILMGILQATIEVPTIAQCSLYETANEVSVMGKMMAFYALGTLISLSGGGYLLSVGLDSLSVCIIACLFPFIAVCICHQYVYTVEEENDLNAKKLITDAEKKQLDMTDGLKRNGEVNVWYGAPMTLAIIIVLANFTVWLCDSAVMDWSVLYMQTTISASELESTIPFIFYSIMTVISATTVDYLYDSRVMTRRALIEATCCLSIIGLGVVAYDGGIETASIGLAIFGCALAGAGIPSMMAICYSAMTSISGISAVEGAVMLTVVGNLAAGISPLVVGSIGTKRDGDLTIMWLYGSLLMFITLLLGEVWICCGGQNEPTNEDDEGDGDLLGETTPLVISARED